MSVILALSVLPLTLPSAWAGEPPKLILQITVDALRGDLPERYSHVLGKSGFRYLMEQGIHYNNAHYQHANTETIVGHTSLATGTVPAAHGMVANVWFDREKDRLVYNIEDPDYQLLTAGADVDSKTEIDPTQRAARVDGRSPANIMSSTFSDELAVHYAGQSKIFAVSVKDRGAVSMAGHAGKAFWFSKSSGEFVTSNYYYRQYPAWVDEWNARKPAADGTGRGRRQGRRRSPLRKAGLQGGGNVLPGLRRRRQFFHHEEKVGFLKNRGGGVVFHFAQISETRRGSLGDRSASARGGLQTRPSFFLEVAASGHSGKFLSPPQI